MTGSSSEQTPVPQSSSFVRAHGERRDLPGSWAAPSRTCSALRPRRTECVRPLTTHSMLPSVRLTTSAPRSVTFRGSITQPVRLLSTLRGSDYSDRHHARLASRWRPTLAGQDLNLLGCFRRFLSVMSLHITSILLRQALPGAPNDVTRRGRVGSRGGITSSPASRSRRREGL